MENKTPKKKKAEKLTNPPDPKLKPNLSSKMKVHFMGIGGSGISAVAALAKNHGFNVSGCDLEKSTAYSDKLNKAKIKVFTGHNVGHIKNYDLLVVSPAIIYQNLNHPEYQKALKENKVVVWNKFVGEYLLTDKNVIAVSGTHGKGTTTAMASLLFEFAQLDPNVIIGATVPQWSSNYRIGDSDIFIIEADEFYEKFLDYFPSTIIINNIEFDHPDYVKNENEKIKSFEKFCRLLKNDRNLIVNLDSQGVIRLLEKLKNIRGLTTYGYSLNPNPGFKTKYLITGNIVEKNPNGTRFRVYSDELGIDTEIKLTIPGDYNVSNALGVIALAKIFKIPDEVTKQILANYNGLGRRFEKVFDKNGIIIYDDYAHHPTAIKKTLDALKQRYPTSRIICINEPHSFSRTKALLDEYKGVFESADKVIIGPIFKARDTKTFGITGKNILVKAMHKDIMYEDSIKNIVGLLKKEIKKGDVVIVMGAGESYLWTREIVKNI